MKRSRIALYLAIAFGWTWTGWAASHLVARGRNLDAGTDGTLFTLFMQEAGTPRFLPQLLFALAVYGPMAGFLAVGGWRRSAGATQPATPNGTPSPGPRLFRMLPVLVPLIIILPTTLVSLLMGLYNPGGRSGGAVLATIGLYFLSNLFTSGTEEFGWRGFLYPAMKAGGASFWDIAWKGGLIWAAWHFPLMILMYLPMGFAVLIPSLIGFCASIVAMNYITNLVYERTGSLPAVMLLHALNNTASFAVALLFPGTPVTILIHVCIWLVVWWLEKRGAAKPAAAAG